MCLSFSPFVINYCVFITKYLLAMKVYQEGCLMVYIVVGKKLSAKQPKFSIFF